MKKSLILVLFSMLLSITGCITHIQRGLDSEFNEKLNYSEMETMFPTLPGFYDWMKQDFITATVDGTNALPKDLKFGFSIGKPHTDTSMGSVYIRGSLDYYGFFRKRDVYMDSFKVQDNAVLAFCNARGYTVQKYKPTFSKKMLNYFGLADLTGHTPANERYGYTYIIYDNSGGASAMYTPVIYGHYSKAFGDINTYYWDAFFISSRKTEQFIDSQKNSFFDEHVIDLR